MTWARLQDELNQCTECRGLGAGLIFEAEPGPTRPPEPPKESLLFVSEAPTPKGGFWSGPSDALHDSLRQILAGSDAELAGEWLSEFVGQGFFLVQSVKWPLRKSARTLTRDERRLIEHSALCHTASKRCSARKGRVLRRGTAVPRQRLWLRAEHAARSSSRASLSSRIPG